MSQVKRPAITICKRFGPFINRTEVRNTQKWPSVFEKKVIRPNIFYFSFLLFFMNLRKNINKEINCAKMIKAANHILNKTHLLQPSRPKAKAVSIIAAIITKQIVPKRTHGTEKSSRKKLILKNIPHNIYNDQNNRNNAERKYKRAEHVYTIPG